MQNIRQGIFQHMQKSLDQHKFQLKEYLDIYLCKFLKNYLQNQIVNEEHMIWHIFSLHSLHMNKLLKDKH